MPEQPKGRSRGILIDNGYMKFIVGPPAKGSSLFSIKAMDLVSWGIFVGSVLVALV